MPVRRNSTSGSVTAFPALGGAAPGATGVGAGGHGRRRTGSVVELVDDVLGDPQRRAEQDHLVVREVLPRGQLFVYLVFCLQPLCFFFCLCFFLLSRLGGPRGVGGGRCSRPHRGAPRGNPGPGGGSSARGGP